MSDQDVLDQLQRLLPRTGTFLSLARDHDFGDSFAASALDQGKTFLIQAVTPELVFQNPLMEVDKKKLCAEIGGFLNRVAKHTFRVSAPGEQLCLRVNPELICCNPLSHPTEARKGKQIVRDLNSRANRVMQSYDSLVRRWRSTSSVGETRSKTGQRVSESQDLGHERPQSVPSIRKLLSGWKDICTAVQLPQDQFRKLRDLNDTRNGPIRTKGAGKPPEVYLDELAKWWNGVADSAEQAAMKKKSKQAALERSPRRGNGEEFSPVKNLGRKGKHIPDENLHIKERRSDFGKSNSSANTAE